MGEPSQVAGRTPTPGAGADTASAGAPPGGESLFLWCAPRLICLAPTADALPLRLGERTRAPGAAMSMQPASGPTAKRRSLKGPREGGAAAPAAPEGSAPDPFRALMESRLPAAFYRGTLDKGVLHLDAASGRLPALGDAAALCAGDD